MKKDGNSMAEIPEIDINLVYQDTRIKLSEALDEASKYKALAQQLLTRVDLLENKLAESEDTQTDTPNE